MEHKRRRHRPGGFGGTGGRWTPPGSDGRDGSGFRRGRSEDPERFRLFCECLRFGANLDRSNTDELERLYSRYATVSSAEDRIRLLVQIASAVEEGIGSVTALLPFILFDPEPSVIRTGALETSLLMPLQDEDPMTGPRHLLETAKDAPDDQRKAGILGGLLLLGDRRVTRLMDGAWRWLAPNARPDLLQAWSGYAFAPMIEFFLDWLRDADEPDSTAVACTLAGIPEMAVHPKVLDLERVFPITDVPDESDRFRVLREWTFEDYCGELSTRLSGSTLATDRPAVMGDLLKAWRIEG